MHPPHSPPARTRISTLYSHVNWFDKKPPPLEAGETNPSLPALILSVCCHSVMLVLPWRWQTVLLSSLEGSDLLQEPWKMQCVWSEGSASNIPLKAAINPPALKISHILFCPPLQRQEYSFLFQQCRKLAKSVQELTGQSQRILGIHCCFIFILIPSWTIMPLLFLCSAVHRLWNSGWLRHS